jgi:photosystem II stability/assembly factor-like uncharacterized protein
VAPLDYLDAVEAQLVALTERGVHRRRRRIAHGVALALPVVVAIAIGLVALATLHAGGGRHRVTSPTTQRHPAPAARTRFAPLSFTAISDTSWWLLGSSTCGRGRCTAIVSTTDGGRHFVRIGAPRGARVSQLRFADASDGFAYGPQLWVTHDAGSTWRQVALGGSVTDLAAADGYVYAIVTGTDGAGRLVRSPANGDSWTTLTEAGDAYSGLWTHGSDVLLEASSRPGIGDQLAVSHNGGASFQHYAAPPSVSCQFEEQAPPVIWAHCATGMLSAVFHSTNYGAAFGQPTRRAPVLPNSAAFGSASSSTAVMGYQQLYRTADGGASWRPVSGPSGITWWQYLGFTDATHGAAIGYVGSAGLPRSERLYYTTDGGLTYHLVTVRLP